jgi:membrane protein DedA with SNARE-associated domain
MPTWLREILASAAAAARTIIVFAVAIAFGVFVAIKIGDGNLWVAAAVAVGALLFVVLPARLWWLKKRSP